MKIYTYKLIDEAESDIKEIFEWYENKFKGLGDVFFHISKRPSTRLRRILMLLHKQVFLISEDLYLMFFLTKYFLS